MALDSMMGNIAMDIAESTKKLFETMVMLDLQPAATSLVEDTHIKTDVIGMVSFTGKCSGVLPFFAHKSSRLKLRQIY